MYLHNIVQTYNNKQLHYNLLNVDKLYFRAVHRSQISKKEFFKIQQKQTKYNKLVLMDNQLELTAEVYLEDHQLEVAVGQAI
jgi:hypothetical protein